VEELKARLAASPFHAALGIGVVRADIGTVIVEFTADTGHLNLQGLVHGGVLATLADTAMGLAARTAVTPGHRHITIQLSVQYVRAAGPGRIVTSGHVVRIGSQIAHATAEITDGDDRVLAVAQGAYSVALERRAGAD